MTSSCWSMKRPLPKKEKAQAILLENALDLKSPLLSRKWGLLAIPKPGIPQLSAPGKWGSSQIWFKSVLKRPNRHLTGLGELCLKIMLIYA